MKQYEFLEHPADLKIRAFGKNLQELFINTALGMMEFLYGEKKQKAVTQKEQIEIHADNIESLLVDWLAELLYLSDARKRNYFNYQIHFFSETEIIATVGSIKAIAKDDIKAVTYHELSISENNGFWTATVVFDI